MKLYDFLTSLEFNQAREHLHAPLISPANLLVTHDISPVFAQYFSHEDHQISLDTLDVKNGLLYFKNILVTANLAAYSGLNFPRIHLSNCQKIQELRAEGHTKTIMISHQLSQIRKVENLNHHRKTQESEQLTLQICRYCLAQLAWGGYHFYVEKQRKNEIIKNFKLIEFYHMYENAQVQAIFSTLQKLPPQFTQLNNLIIALKQEQIQFKHRQQTTIQMLNQQEIFNLEHHMT